MGLFFDSQAHEQYVNAVIITCALLFPAHGGDIQAKQLFLVFFEFLFFSRSEINGASSGRASIRRRQPSPTGRRARRPRSATPDGEKRLESSSFWTGTSGESIKCDCPLPSVVTVCHIPTILSFALHSRPDRL
jgi:hypothetical protein